MTDWNERKGCWVLVRVGDWGCETESDGTSTEFLLQIKDRQKEVGNI